ncbi:PqqD family protein [Solemya velum gill symbiont]|uniref:PqqD family protein n=1 Tax=Solemya velum gill symbiont TaxID=2340 RepID=UPI000996ED5D|nr:PqqD family protein [Solemya velum gill symbiont]OOZ44758.1 hypothetical protein BOW37_05615 [Solemya velum gill symbiont]OOZ46884.1 hypothetical protein BOW38_05835 [Solemya velum gill symbiont]OOZ50587.1 hypothetical protein BOW39_02200 [Solemya velum gill symbiont]OOZ51832.1 hypothetical protein BOW40_05675 [Solemya velum gill symbiont]OOZ54374.1 hypothetical protein BOW41_06380 [Solemya velum gill symbiont]
MFNSHLLIPSHVQAQEVSDETVLLDLESEVSFGLDEIGTRVWQLIRESGDPEAIFDTILSEYEVSAEQLESDLDALYEKLLQAGLVVRGDE